MQIRTIYYIICFAFLISFISCRKSNPTDQRSPGLALLQNTWNYKVVTINEIGGTLNWRTISSVPCTYTFGLDNIYYQKTQNASFDYPYTLLQGDSILIFIHTDVSGNISYDTNYITSLTPHLLAYYSFDLQRNFINIDTLTR